MKLPVTLRTFILLVLMPFLLRPVTAVAQGYEMRSVFYNTFIGAFSGSLGSFINKPKGEKWYKALLKGFVIGTGGGFTMYVGKKMNYLINSKHELAYGYLSRAVFCAGNSLVENAAAHRDFWSVWHYDFGFARFEYHVQEKKFQPKIMPSVFAGTVYLAVHGNLDVKTTLHLGTPVFRARNISYEPRFTASTVTNGFLMKDSLRGGTLFYEIVAHEMVHTFQFQEWSGLNYFTKPLTDKWKNNSAWFRKASRWVYGDLNYEIMGINYFLIQRGKSPTDYCHNFLENEAETLSTNRPACPKDK